MERGFFWFSNGKVTFFHAITRWQLKHVFIFSPKSGEFFVDEYFSDRLKQPTRKYWPPNSYLSYLVGMFGCIFGHKRCGLGKFSE